MVGALCAGDDTSGRVGGTPVPRRLDPARGAVLRLDWKTVKELDRASLERTLGPVDLDGDRRHCAGRVAIQKGHRYATVIVEPMRKRVLWVGRGRGREDIRPFFALLGPHRCHALRAAVMDMNAGYELEVQAHCPNAAIVFDLFHVCQVRPRVIDRCGSIGPMNCGRSPWPARRQGRALVAAEKPQLARARPGRRTRRTAGRQPQPVRRLCAARCPQGSLAVPSPRAGRLRLAQLVSQGPA